MLKLVRRFDKLGSPLLFSLFKAIPICPLRSTVTKLVRTFESGRGDVPVLVPPKFLAAASSTTKNYSPTDPAGERPLSGGLDAVSLFSNIARKLRTPPDILAA